MIKPAAIMALPLFALAACNSNSRDAEDIAARPTADVTASDIATGAATMVPPVGSPGTPSDRTQTGASPTPAPTDAGRSGINRTTGTTGSGANRPNAGATTQAMPQE
ncbi:hypothetical protein [Novosphingobium ginsenosidimutans]|uniref:Lipoprotein n=1 Tax=Novosphingobium ginsenosidimutans TaxID=1176536 RepID=A0A5B8S3F6_9SPHN|nr:hypothetical protein [Novosphingobium ginsenosidimutans]QEA16019.1 hypothetical protein FRF71_07655 [Novosphingobium ginsenosidimutans]